jgi:hypothetical protein
MLILIVSMNDTKHNITLCQVKGPVEFCIFNAMLSAVMLNIVRLNVEAPIKTDEVQINFHYLQLCWDLQYKTFLACVPLS